MGDILRIKGFEPIPVSSGGAALEIVSQQEIHVVLIDLRLGDIPGLEVLRG